MSLVASRKPPAFLPTSIKSFCVSKALDATSNAVSVSAKPPRPPALRTRPTSAAASGIGWAFPRAPGGGPAVPRSLRSRPLTRHHPSSDFRLSAALAGNNLVRELKPEIGEHRAIQPRREDAYPVRGPGIHQRVSTVGLQVILEVSGVSRERYRSAVERLGGWADEGGSRGENGERRTGGEPEHVAELVSRDAREVECLGADIAGRVRRLIEVEIRGCFERD